MRCITKNATKFNVAPSNEYFNSFWSEVEGNTWENHTFKALDDHLNKNSYIIDVGAWIGPITLYAASVGCKVYAFEPDPVAHAELKNNLSVNQLLVPKVDLHQMCISDSNGLVSFGNVKARWGNSGSSMLSGSGFVTDLDCDQRGNWQVQTQVEAITLDTFFANKHINKCDFVKIDIEGGEIKVMPSLINIIEKYMPVLYLSMHAPHFTNFNDDIEKITKTISAYPNIRDSTGKKLSLNDIKTKYDFYDIVCTK